MSLPDAISKCTVTFGSAASYLGATASITATLSADRNIVHAATGLGVYSSADPVAAVAGAPLSFAVPHVDQSGFIDSSGNEIKGWFYILSGQVRFESGPPISFRRNFQVVVGQTNVDLDLVPEGPVLPAFSTPLATVTSVNGQTGAVTVAGGVSRQDIADDIADPDSQIGEALASEFVSTAGTLLATNQAVDDAKEPGFYTVSNTVTNVPLQGSQTLVVIAGPADPASGVVPVTQTLTVCFDASDIPQVFVRAWDVLNDGPWSGWTQVPTAYQSGKRDITSTDILGGDNGILWRIGDRCYLDLNPNQDSIDPTLWNALPNGFRSISDGGYQSAGLAFDDSGKPIATVMVEHNGFIFLPELPTVSTPIAYAVGLVSWLTADAPPITLPGTPFF